MMYKGFTTLFAVLIASLLLAVGLAIFEITVKQVLFAQIVRDSDIAIYASDSGAECALYWDFKCSLGACTATGASAFATSSSFTQPASGVICNVQDIASSWTVLKSASAATTTFSLTFPGSPYCATVEVAKWGNPSNTKIISRGYNTCISGGTNRIERALQVTY